MATSSAAQLQYLPPHEPDPSDPVSCHVKAAFQDQLDKRKHRVVETFVQLVDPNAPLVGEKISLEGIQFDSHAEAAFYLLGLAARWTLHREPVGKASPDFLRITLGHADLIEIKPAHRRSDLFDYIQKLQTKNFTLPAMILFDDAIVYQDGDRQSLYEVGYGATDCRIAAPCWTPVLAYPCYQCGRLELHITDHKPVPWHCNSCAPRVSSHIQPPSWQDYRDVLAKAQRFVSRAAILDTGY